MTTLAFLGLGRMGTAMAANLAAAGHDLTVWNRSPDKARDFAARHGVTAADTPADAVGGAEVVITMLADDAALLATYTGPEGALAGLAPGAVAIDMGTVAPGTVRTLRDLLAEREVPLIDAPVSGSVAAATGATLTIMAAGDPDVLDRVRPVLAVLGKNILHLGGTGTGAAMKLVVNSVVHGLNQIVSEALVLAERAGIDRSAAYEVFAASAVSAPFVHYRRESFERPGEVPVLFRLALAGKDLRLAVALAEEVGAELPQTRTNLAVLDAARTAGFGEADESAVAQYLREKE